MKFQSRVSLLLAVLSMSTFMLLSSQVVRGDEDETSPCCAESQCTAFSECFDEGFCLENNKCQVVASPRKCRWVPCSEN